MTNVDLDIFVSLWLNECDGCVTMQDPNFSTVTLPIPEDNFEVWKVFWLK